MCRALCQAFDTYTECGAQAVAASADHAPHTVNARAASDVRVTDTLSKVGVGEAIRLLSEAQAAPTAKHNKLRCALEAIVGTDSSLP